MNFEVSEVKNPLKKNFRIHKAKNSSKKFIKFKRQGTLIQKSKEINGSFEPNKKMSFASVKNSNFNLSFKDLSFSPQKEIQKRQLSSSSSEFIQEVNPNAATFGRSGSLAKKLDVTEVKVKR